MSRLRELNIRDVGGGVVPRGLFIRSGKLSLLTKEECAMLCDSLGIKCVIDLRTPIESAEFPDPLPRMRGISANPPAERCCRRYYP